MLGKVESVNGDYAKVSIERQEMCGECHACEMVGEVKKCQINCHNCCESQVGDVVEIDLAQNQFLKATALMYGLPLVGLLGGLGIGTLIPLGGEGLVQEGMMVLLGLVGMGMALLWLRSRDKKRKYEACVPRLIKIVREEECGQE